MSRAQKWRNYLLGSPSTIYLLRESKEIKHKENKHEEVIRNDLKRTYPLNDFFTDRIGDLSNVLNTYAHINEGMGYAQGMAFIAFNLYKIYYEEFRNTTKRSHRHCGHRAQRPCRVQSHVGAGDQL